jgi:hypothetical protein
MRKEIIKQMVSGAFVFVVIGSLLGSLVYFFPERSGQVPIQVKKAMEVINEIAKNQGQSATLISFSEEGGVYKIDFKIGDQQYRSFITKDGRYFFPYGLDLSQGIGQIQTPEGQATGTSPESTSSQP